MIEPKEKAKELVEKFKEFTYDWSKVDGFIYDNEEAKKCALIAVNEIIEALEHHSWQNRHWLGYYDEVKQEIEKL